MDIEEAKDLLSKLTKDNISLTFQDEIEAIETVLNELEKKDKVIENLKKQIPSIANGTYIGDCEGLLKLEQEIIKRDKVINEMATTLSSVCTGIDVIIEQFNKKYCEFINSDEDCCWKTDKECSDCIKEYFTNKAENVGE